MTNEMELEKKYWTERRSIDVKQKLLWNEESVIIVKHKLKFN